ncbi:MAG: ferredoxin [Pirellulaceae bacterium]
MTDSKKSPSKSVAKKIDAARRELKTATAPRTERQLLLCVDRKTAECASRSSMTTSWKYLKKRTKELKLSRASGLWRVPCYCLGVCVGGPIAVVLPDNCWYGHCTPQVIERILKEHIIGGTVVSEYMISPKQLGK